MWQRSKLFLWVITPGEHKDDGTMCQGWSQSACSWFETINISWLTVAPTMTLWQKITTFLRVSLTKFVLQAIQGVQLQTRPNIWFRWDNEKTRKLMRSLSYSFMISLLAGSIFIIFIMHYTLENIKFNSQESSTVSDKGDMKAVQYDVA